MNDVNSLFDSLTVSAPSLGADSPAAAGSQQQAVAAPVAPPQSAYTLPPVNAGSYQPSPSLTPAPVAAPTMVGSTRLIARVDPQEFVRVVSGAGAGTIVLVTSKGKGNTSRADGTRYVACVSGIVLITNSGSSLRFPSPVQVIEAAAVLCEGRPLSNDDYM